MKKLLSIFLTLAVLFHFTSVSISAKEFSEYENITPTGREVLMMEMLEDSMGEMANFRLIDWEEQGLNVKAVLMEPTDPGFSYELGLALLEDEIALENWDLVVESLTSLSESIVTLVNNKDYILMIMNPADLDLNLLMVWDGVLIYDAVNNYDAMANYK